MASHHLLGDVTRDEIVVPPSTEPASRRTVASGCDAAYDARASEGTVDEIVFRRLTEQDSITELTDLLHAAYAELADAGMRFVASHQPAEVTRRRAAQGECWVAVSRSELVGTLTVVPPGVPAKYHWYTRSGVARLNQFGVRPDMRGRGIGDELMRIGERRAVEMGATEVALDTAEGALRLIETYSRRGYRFIDYADWRPETNYRSVVLSKSLVSV
jgi:GNAT superfamily N-acetyltransferase